MANCLIAFMVTTYKKYSLLTSVLVPLLYTSYVEAYKLSRVSGILIMQIKHSGIHYFRNILNRHAPCLSRNLVQSGGRDGLWEGG